MKQEEIINSGKSSERNPRFTSMSQLLRRAVAICLLVLVSAGAWAQWTDANGVTFSFVSGSAGYSEGEGPSKICDNDQNTKFCGNCPATFVVKASEPIKLTKYILTTANDNATCTGRNPKSWTIEGSLDGEHWDPPFVSETGNTTMQNVNYTSYTFNCNSVNYYKFFRLSISATQGDVTLQFSEFHPLGSVDIDSYVFISEETNGYFLNSSAQATQTFDESTCVWTAGGVLSKANTSTTLNIGTTYLRGYNSNDANNARIGSSTDYFIQRWRSVDGYLVHYNSEKRYVYRDENNAAAWPGNTGRYSSGTFRVYVCTKIDGGIDGSITGADHIATTGTSESYAGAASYTPEHYKFYGLDTRYYADGYTGATTTMPSTETTSITYSNWTLEGADGYATVNSTTGVVTYSNLVPEGGRIVTLKCTATHTASGKTAVLTKDIVLINENIQTIVYLDPSEQYGGSDSNPGTKAYPVKTWKHAYSLLNPYGTVYNNYIILMSEYYYDINGDKGLATFQSGTGETTYQQWKDKVESVGMNVPATITSYLHDNDGNVVTGEIDYSSTGTNPAQYKFVGLEKYLFICADTRFEWMSFYGSAETWEIFFAQYFNVEFGHGLKMSHFDNGKTFGVLCEGSYACDFQVFGGLNNDARFKSDPRGFEEHLPHAKDGFKMIFRSGHFSNVCAGGRQADNNTNGVFGTPRQPIKAQIIVDIDRTWNDTYKQCITSNKTTPGSNKSANYDIGMLLAGNHEGCMYGDVDLIVLSGYVARVVNGTLGARRTIQCNVGSGRYPFNAYMGRANALMDPSKMVDAHGNIVARTTSYSDATAYITELYGGGLGRPLQANGLLNLPVYGKNTVTINGGTIGIVPAEITSNTGGGLNTVIPAVFGGASGGVNGIGDDDSRTQKQESDVSDMRIPYWHDNQGQVAYTTYDLWKDKDDLKKHVQVHCYDGYNETTNTDDYTDIDLQYASTQVTINGGTFGTAERPIDGIYGGGSGYINGWIYPAATDQSFPFSDAGTLYGKPGEVASNLTINGGTFYCNIYGAGRGTGEYYSKKMYDANKCERYTALAKVYGDVEVNINGGTIYGNVYGGGAGVAELLKYKSESYFPDTYGQMTDMARLTGNSTVNISGNATITSFTYNGNTIGGNVYGGGMLAGVTGTSTVNVEETATVTGNVYAAAQGIPANASTTSQTISGANKTYYLYTAANANLFGIVSGNTTVNIDDDAVVGGDIFGGAESASCGTDASSTATVNIYSAGEPLNNVYGGNNISGNIYGRITVNVCEDESDCDVEVDNVYGGGNLAVYSVYGYNNDGTPKTSGDTVHGPQVNIYGGTIGSVYGAGKGNGETVTTDVYKGHLFGNTHVYMKGGTCDNIYGGGEGAPVTGNTNVTVNVTTPAATGEHHIHECVFGGGLGAAAIVNGNTKVTITGSTAIGKNVYGGGNAGKVTGNTHVDIGGVISE